MNKVWTEYEKEFIRVNADRFTDEQLAKQLQRVCGRKVTLYSIRKVRQSLGIKKKPGRGICSIDLSDKL
jgi:hypothetical protein